MGLPLALGSVARLRMLVSCVQPPPFSNAIGLCLLMGMHGLECIASLGLGCRAHRPVGCGATRDLIGRRQWLRPAGVERLDGAVESTKRAPISEAIGLAPSDAK